MTKYGIVLCLCFMQIKTILAQQQLFFDCLTIREGLPHNSIFDIVQDETGMMWLGAQNGLLRYDGYAFKDFTKVKSQQGDVLNLGSVHALHLDRKGLLWVGTNTEGLLCLDTKKGLWQQKMTITSRINSIFEDKNGNIWVGTMGNGIFEITPDNQGIKNFFSHNSVIRNDNIFEFAEDKNGNIWFAAAGQGIYYFDPKNQQVQAVQNTTSPTEDLNSFRKCLYLSPNQQLWIGTEGDGLYIYDIEKNQFTHYSKKSANKILTNNISDICALSDGQVWLSSDGGGLMICNSQNMTFSYESFQENTHNKLNTNNLLKLYKDKNENVWIATFNGGVNIWKKNKTRFLDVREWTKQNVSLSNRSVLSVCESQNNSVWIGTDGGGIDMWDKRTGLWKNYRSNNDNTFPAGNVVKSLLSDSKGNIWAGYFGKGLDCYNPNSKVFKHFQKDVQNQNALSGENIWTLAEDNLGNIWIGTLDGGVNKYNPADNTFKRFLRNPNIPTTIAGNSIFALLPIENEQVWIGTQNSGLDLLDEKTGTFTHFRHDEKNHESISANDIRCIFKDKKNRTWIGTESGGLNLWLGDGKFKKLNTPQELLSDAVVGITEDENGFLWLSSFQGITRFDADKELLLNYNFHTTERSNLFNHLAITRLSDGALCFGGINGINVLINSTIITNKENSDVQITDFKVFNQSITPFDESRILSQSLAETNEIHLDYTQSLFSFEFSALDFTAPEEVKYAYFLENFDKDWQYVNHNERSATYNNLPHGTYVFHVKASNTDGSWSNHVRAIRVVVHPPFWKTLWFRILLSILIFAALFGLFRLYVRRQQEQFKAAMLEQEQEILRLENEKLEHEIETKNADLMSKALQMGHKNEVMRNIMENLKELKSEQSETNLKKVRTLEKIVNTELQDEDNWQQLNVYFDKVNHNFTERLFKEFPNLTQNDLRLCILIKLNLSVKEMAALLNVSVGGIEKGKYRLKKRLNLGIDEDLNEFLKRF